MNIRSFGIKLILALLLLGLASAHATHVVFAPGATASVESYGNYVIDIPGIINNSSTSTDALSLLLVAGTSPSSDDMVAGTVIVSMKLNELDCDSHFMPMHLSGSELDAKLLNTMVYYLRLVIVEYDGSTTYADDAVSVGSFMYHDATVENHQRMAFSQKFSDYDALTDRMNFDIYMRDLDIHPVVEVYAPNPDRSVRASHASAAPSSPLGTAVHSTRTCDMHELDDLYSKLNDAKADYRRHRFDMQHTKDQTEIMNSGDLASSSQRLSQTIESSIDRYRSSHGCE
jgi:hypothetical protein